MTTEIPNSLTAPEYFGRAGQSLKPGSLDFMPRVLAHARHHLRRDGRLLFILPSKFRPRVRRWSEGSGITLIEVREWSSDKNLYLKLLSLLYLQVELRLSVFVFEADGRRDAV